MGNDKNNHNFGKLLLIVLMMASGIQYANALPSYARQTGLSCEACHNSFPELTAFGRQFKLNGYTLTGMQTINSTDSGDVRLNLLSTLPISAMAQASFTHISKDLPGTQNNNADFPQQLSIFYAGQITPHIGTFIQVTYSSADGTFGMDNTDIRYSNQTSLFNQNLTYGFSLNNNPTVQDLWNTLPAWGYRYSSSGVAPTPAVATLLEGGMANQGVAGLGAYALYNNLIYGELSLYRSAQQGMPNPPDSTNSGIIKGASPYWRLALQHQASKDYFSIGTVGLSAKEYPAGVSGLTDNILDIGFDAQYEHIFDFGTLTLHSLWIKETQKLNASQDTLQSNNLSSFKIDGNIFLKKRIGATVGYFNLSGNSNENLYGQAPSGDALTPNSSGFIAQFDYLPWYNTKFSLQYIMYNKFDGLTSDIDGIAGRKPGDNNTLYLLVWLNF
jgi:hypothetical protein